MKRLIIAAGVAALCMPAVACNGLAKAVEAANELDPGCYKDVRAFLVPVFPGVVTPFFSYVKVCNPGQAGPAPAPPIVGAGMTAAPLLGATAPQ